MSSIKPVSFKEKVYAVMTLKQAERVWAYVQVCPHGEACVMCCWEWQSFKTTRGGYGAYTIGSKKTPYQVRMNRMIWVLTGGDIPHGHLVLHRCDNPPCVNPAHLWIGTDADNMRDRDQKGRLVININHINPENQARGEKHGHAKLTAEQVQTIRALHGTMSQSAIAKQFGVNRSTISEIQSGKKWRHLLKTDDERQS